MTLTEARARARLASGRIRPAAVGRSGVGHLAASHPLSGKAKARCLTLGHVRGRGKGVGGIACGECWEHVIRADERLRAHQKAGASGECPTCGTPTTTDVTPTPQETP